MAKKLRRQRNLDSIIVDIIPSDPRYNIITIPKIYRRFFPPYKVVFDLERNNADTRPAWMTSAYSDSRVEDEEAGQYICGRLKEWYKNNDVEAGDRAKIKRLKNPINSGRLAYRLIHLPNNKK